MAFIPGTAIVRVRYDSSFTCSRVCTFSQPVVHVPSGHRVRSPSPKVRVTTMQGPARSTECDTPVKKFLDKLKGLERVRLIVRNEAGILEAIGTFDGLFFATIPSGTYANLIYPKDNLDLHLLLEKVTGAKFDVGVSRTASKAPTYAIRILGSDKETVVLSVFLQWDKEPEDIAEARVECWKNLKQEYSPESDTFFF